MKIGIITFNRAINYGAVLQGFALKQKVSEYEQTEIINYICPHIEKMYKYFNGNKLKGVIRFLQFNKRNRKISRFAKQISSSKIYDKYSLCEIDCEKIIVGSDQVWNYNCSGKDENFLLPNIKTKKYSYAASFGVSLLPEIQVPFFKENISKFSYISVREKTGQHICKKQLGVLSEVVLDPTLLLTKKEWRTKLNIRENNKGYVLVYSFATDKVIKETARKVSKQIGLPVYNISLNLKDFFGDKVIKTAGVEDWVELFYNAAFVITDSFHGTAFSINFNKPFYSFANNDRASRIVDLLDSFSLQSRLNPSLKDVDLQDQIDYDDINEKLIKERKKSIEFIEKIIND